MQIAQSVCAILSLSYFKPMRPVIDLPSDVGISVEPSQGLNIGKVWEKGRFFTLLSPDQVLLPLLVWTKGVFAVKNSILNARTPPNIHSQWNVIIKCTLVKEIRRSFYFVDLMAGIHHHHHLHRCGWATRQIKVWTGEILFPCLPSEQQEEKEWNNEHGIKGRPK